METRGLFSCQNLTPDKSVRGFYIYEILMKGNDEMKKTVKRMIGFMLVIMLCLLAAPMPSLAAETPQTEQPSVEPVQTGQSSTESTAEAAPLPSETMEATPTPEATDAPKETPEPEGTDQPNALSDGDKEETPEPISVTAEPVKTVSEPLVKVVYNYFDEAKNTELTGFDGYEVESSHSFYALAKADGDKIAIGANKYPDKVPVSTETLRFRVLMNETMDITANAEYDAESGTLYLPSGFMGHKLTVMWHCPLSEVTEVPVKAKVSVYENGKFSTSVQEMSLPTNAGSITVQLNKASGIVVAQNGIDFPISKYSLSDGNLVVKASPLGGDITVAAYAASSKTAMLRSTAATRVVHTRSEDQIYYGYYTSYYTANGNTAFCLDPTVSGLNAGTYDISRWLNRGTDDLLIKCAYYLYGGPGYNSVKSHLFENPDSMVAYGLSHAVAAYVYMQSEDAFKQLDSGVIEHLKNVVASINVQPMPPAGFNVFIYNEGSSTNQCLMGWDYTPTGNVEIIKQSSNPKITEGNGCYSLEGAVFFVYNGAHQQIGTITTNAEGKGRLDHIEAGSGYYIVEQTPPRGYAEDKTPITFVISAGGTTNVQVKDIPQNDPATVVLKKTDADKNKNEAQGNAGLAGAEFTFQYYDGYYSTAAELKGKVPTRTWVVKTDKDGFAYLHKDYVVSGDELYFNGAGDLTLPLGTVTIRESKTPTGYLLNNELFIRQITANGKAESVFTYNAPVVKDEVIRGGVLIEKWDAELNAKQPQGDATLVNAVLDIYNRSENSVVVGGKTYAPGQVVHTMKTDATGTAKTAADLLPYGKYEIVERTAPSGYLNTGAIRRTFSIVKDGAMVELKASDTAIKNNVIRGGVRIEKWDSEIDENKAQGGATLEGAVFEIVNRSANIVKVQGKNYAPGEVVYTMTTDKTGAAETSKNLLPYGSYEAREVEPPDQGYLAQGVLVRQFKIRENGVIVDLNTTDTAIKNAPIRGDLKGVKISDGDAKRMENVPFSITSKTTGESHIIVTDRNGEFNTASSWNLHSQNTNRGEKDTDGIWFGDIATLNDDLGALIYDTYILKELPCEANKDKELLSFEVSIYRNSTTVDLGTLTDDYIVVPEIFTTAMDKKSGTNEAFVAESTTIVDTVYYNNLKVGTTYTVRGVLMDKETGKAFLNNGKEVTAEKTFKALAASGTVNMEFTFDSSAIKGKAVVVFEKLYQEDKEIAAHAEIEDTDQTVTFKEPKIGTKATGETGEKEMLISDTTTIKDTVSYKNLIAGKEYTVRGTFMDKETGEPVLVDGEPVISEKIFVAEKETGSVDMEFVFSSLALKGKEVVAFETLMYEGREIAVHADLNDRDQTVKFKEPVIGTKAMGENGEKEILIAKSVTIVDEVRFENLITGKEYVLKGILMDKATGQPLMADGKQITAEMRFTPSKSSGSVRMTFGFDASALKGKETVVFERLYRNGVEIATHADIADKGQTVKFKAPSSGAQTGRDGLPLWALLLGIACVAGAIGVTTALIVKSRKKEKKQEGR